MDAQAPDCHRPTQHREGAGFAVAVLAPGWWIDRRHRVATRMSGSAEERRHFLLQEMLQLGLDLATCPLLQRVVTRGA
ncbi:MAG: hypothetical protein OEY77_09335 [Nitrospira sp.]|nr:hypothetical protein [Nitrospira sp.]